MQKREYKQIVFNNHPDISLLEFDLFENDVKNMEDFILKITLFVELIGYKKPKYVLFNKSNTNFEIDKSFYQFTYKQIVDAIFEFGVAEILFCINDNKLDRTKNIKRPNVHVFNSMDDILNHINENRSK